MTIFGEPNFEKLARKGEIKKLQNLLTNSRTKKIQILSVHALAFTREDEAVKILINSLKQSNDNGLVNEIIKALGENKCYKAKDSLLDYLLRVREIVKQRKLNPIMNDGTERKTLEILSCSLSKALSEIEDYRAYPYISHLVTQAPNTIKKDLEDCKVTLRKLGGSEYPCEICGLPTLEGKRWEVGSEGRFYAPLGKIDVQKAIKATGKTDLRERMRRDNQDTERRFYVWGLCYRCSRVFTKHR
jgi:hypothetical protein